MERRVRLNWSAKRQRAWCTGLSLPKQIGTGSASALTGFMRVQGLMERIRARRGSTQESVRAPLPAGRDAARDPRRAHHGSPAAPARPEPGEAPD